MTCPHCKHSRSRVVDSRTQSNDTTTYRRRECSKCGKRYSTYEVGQLELWRLRSADNLVRALSDSNDGGGGLCDENMEVSKKTSQQIRAARC